MWVIGSAVSGVILGPITLILLDLIAGWRPIDILSSIERFSIGIVFGGVYGVTSGFMQYSLLRREISRTRNALSISFVGSLTSLAIFSTSPNLILFFLPRLHAVFTSHFGFDPIGIDNSFGEGTAEILVIFVLLLATAAIGGFTQGFVQWHNIGERRTSLLQWVLVSTVSGVVGLIVLLILIFKFLASG